MKPVSPVIPNEKFDEIIVAENQPEYQNLPVIPCGGGALLSRWHLSEDERRIVAETGDVYVFIHTFGQPVQPVMLQVEKPGVETHEPEGITQMIAVRSTEKSRAKAANLGIKCFSRVCAGCHSEVIVSEVSMKAVDRRGLRIVCQECAADVPDENLRVLPETVAEIQNLAANLH